MLGLPRSWLRRIHGPFVPAASVCWGQSIVLFFGSFGEVFTSGIRVREEVEIGSYGDRPFAGSSATVHDSNDSMRLDWSRT